jgi:hypothetical protein
LSVRLETKLRKKSKVAKLQHIISACLGFVDFSSTYISARPFMTGLCCRNNIAAGFAPYR